MAEVKATEHVEDDDRYNVFDVEGLAPVIADMGTGGVDDTIGGRVLSSCEELFPPPSRLHRFRIIQEIAMGLAHLRTVTIVPRDLKPANILLGDCCVVGPEKQGKETTQGSQMDQSKGMTEVGFYHREQLHKEVLSRFTKKSSVPFSSYVESMEGMLSGGEMSDCEGKMLYSNIQRTGLLRKMILDGAFVLEILRHVEMVENPEFVFDFPSNDPIFSSQGMLYNLPFIRRDMLNINNQVPMMILEVMVSLQSGRTDKKGIRKEIVLKQLNLLVPSLQPSNFEGLHALDIIRNNLVGSKAPQPLPRLLSRFHSIDCIVTLLAGISRKGHHDSKFQSLSLAAAGNIGAADYKSIQGGIFTAKSLAESFLADISFFQCGLLRLHTLTIDDTTEDLFTNLMAFERHQRGRKGWHVTSYVYFMSSLIQSPQDAGLLRRSCIIKTARMSDHEVARLFCTLRSGITLQGSDYCLMKTHLDILSYHRKACPMWVASLWSSFLDDPLAFVFCMAVLLLGVVHLLSVVVFGRI